MGTVEGWAEVCLGNPFAPHPDRAAAEAAIADVAQRPAQALEDLAFRSQVKEARRLALAVACHDTARGADSRLFDPRAVPDRLLTAMAFPRRAIRDAAATAATRTAAAIRLLAGDSAAMTRVRAAVWRACFGESIYDAIRLRPLIREQNVLILGETGTGKELVALAIAAADPDPGRLQIVNAAAIPGDLLEAELFGHARGAFTGAVGEREGKIVAAESGTLFLDEIADLPPQLQAKLLRVVEDDRVTPVGSNQTRKVDVRYVSATSQPLPALVERGEFRRDLYERFAGVTLELPPLRDRVEDLVPIADSLFHRTGARLDGGDGDVGASTTHLAKLVVVQARFRAWLAGAEARARPWRGNVRELQSLMRSWILGFEEGRPAAPPREPTAPALARFVDAQATLREVEDWYILQVMERVQYRQRQAAEILGVDRGTLARRLRSIDPVGER